MKTNESEVLLFYVKPPQAQATRDNLVTYLTQGTHPTLNDADLININGQPHGKARIQFNLTTTGDFDEITRILNGDEPMNNHEPTEPVKAGTATIELVPDLKRLRQFLQDLIDLIDRYDDEPETLGKQSAQQGT